MPIVLQIFTVIVCLAFFAYIVYLVKRERLMLKYSLLWLFLGLVILVCAIFPEPVFAFSALIGFENPSNFLFFVGLFFALAIALSLTSIVSKQTYIIKNLTQQIALNEHSAEHAGDGGGEVVAGAGGDSGGKVVAGADAAAAADTAGGADAAGDDDGAATATDSASGKHSE